jgi:23S rRNA pseudouridine2457 synthase
LGVGNEKEGKFRQIRKMTAAVGFPQTRSRANGNVYLNSLLAGEVVEVLDFNGNVIFNGKYKKLD